MGTKACLNFWLVIVFSGLFCMEMSARNRVVIVNECEGYSDNINVFLRNLEIKSYGASSPTLYFYPRFEALAYWRGNDDHFLRNIRNLQTSCLVSETVGEALSSECDTVRVVNPGELTVLKGYWNLFDQEMDADTLRNRLRNLLCDRHECDTLLLLTSCLSDFHLRSRKEPGKKPRDVSGEVNLTIRVEWAVYDKATGKLVKEFQTEGKAGEAWNRITREQAYKLRDDQWSPELIQDSSEIAKYNTPFLRGKPSIPSVKDLSTFHFGEPAVYPLIRIAAEQIADRLQEGRVNGN